MSGWPLFIGILTLAYLGWGLLALGQERHWRRVAGTTSRTPFLILLLRGLGGVALAASFAIALLSDGPSFGTLLWVTMLSLSAIAVAFTLAWRPGWLRPLAACLAWTAIGERASRSSPGRRRCS